MLPSPAEREDQHVRSGVHNDGLLGEIGRTPDEAADAQTTNAAEIAIASDADLGQHVESAEPSSGLRILYRNADSNYPVKASLAIDLWRLTGDEQERSGPDERDIVRRRGARLRNCQTLSREPFGYPRPPKSSCIGCPFHSDAAWRRMRDHDPDAWADAVDLDRTIRTGFRGLRGEVYLHRSAVPLGEADLSTDADRGQLDLWPNECEGMCGV